MPHLTKRSVIHAPLEKVYALARDPRWWSSWYVGVSEGEEVRPELRPRPSAPTHLMVGMPFPLTQRILDDRIAGDRAHWRARTQKRRAESAQVGPDCTMVMLGGESEWTYLRSNGDTEVTVDVEFTAQGAVSEPARVESLIAHLESDCLERSLANLKRLCEAA